MRKDPHKIISTKGLAISLFVASVIVSLNFILLSDFAKNGPDFANYFGAYQNAVTCGSCQIGGLGLVTRQIFLFAAGLKVDYLTVLVVISFFTMFVKIRTATGLLGGTELVVLIMYMSSLFWLHELIQLKISIAFSAFMLALFLHYKKEARVGSAILGLVSVLAHTSVLFLWGAWLLHEFVSRRGAAQLLTTTVLIILPCYFFLSFADAEILIREFLVASRLGSTSDYVEGLLNTEAARGVRVFNVHSIATIITIGVYIILDQKAKRAKLARQSIFGFIAFAAGLAIFFKWFFSHSPVVSFRVFELLVAPMFVLQALVTTHKLLTIPFRVMFGFFFVLTNLYSYVYLNPIFIGIF